jgi:hypothetical protein
MNFIMSMLSGKGPISTMRVITVSTAFTVLGIYIAQNILGMIQHTGYVDFPPNSVYALLVVIGGKATQAIFGEKNGTTPSSPTAPVAPATPLIGDKA